MLLSNRITDVPASPARPGERAGWPARLRRRAGRARRALARLRDQTLHPWRRRRARARLRALPPPRNVLFLCLGNVCRSPYAEYRFRALAAARGHDTLTVDSAGFIGPGRAPAELALDAARARGIDTGTHRSRVVDDALFAAADLIVLVDAAHGRRLRRLHRSAEAARGGGTGATEATGGPVAATRTRPATVVLGDLDPEPARRRRIRDPWGQEPEIFERVFDRLDRCLEALAELVLPSATRGAAADGEGDDR